MPDVAAAVCSRIKARSYCRPRWRCRSPLARVGHRFPAGALLGLVLPAGPRGRRCCARSHAGERGCRGTARPGGVSGGAPGEGYCPRYCFKPFMCSPAEAFGEGGRLLLAQKGPTVQRDRSPRDLGGGGQTRPVSREKQPPIPPSLETLPSSFPLRLFWRLFIFRLEMD